MNASAPGSGAVLAVTYLSLVGVAMFLIVAFPPPGEMAYLSVYGLGAVMLLTLPWSLIMIVFIWALVHDAQNIIFLLFFAACAGLNAYLIRRAVNGAARVTSGK